MIEKIEILQYKKFNKKYNYSFLIFLLFIGLFILTIFMYDKYHYFYQNMLIANDIEKLDSIFKEINKTSRILDFRQDRNYIDFLNTQNFAGSTVGPMNLKYPQNWKGPYLTSNPVIKEKFYEVIKTKNGYFIVPPEGIKLSKNKIIGNDIILNEQADIEQMIKDPNLLFFNNRPLAAKIESIEEINEDKNNIVEASMIENAMDI